MAWSSLTQTDFLTLDANYEFFVASSNAVVVTTTTGYTYTFTFNVDSAGTTDDVEVQILVGQRVSTGNGLDGATSASDVEIDTGAEGFSTDDELNGLFLIMTNGDEQGEGRLITDSVAADDGVSLSHALSGTPSAGETYDLYRFSELTTLVIDASTTASDDVPRNAGVSVHSSMGQYIAIRARATGATDAHRIKAAYQDDGGIGV